MVGSFDIVSARPWHAKSYSRRVAELQYETDRHNSHIAKENWKTSRQLMQNDLANVIDAEEMVANYGPTSYMPELSLMSMLNNRLARLSTAPAYKPQIASFPVPLVNPMNDMVLALPPLPPPIAHVPTPVPVPAALPVPVPVPVPVPGFADPYMHGQLDVFNGIPVTVAPVIVGYQTMVFLCPVEAWYPPAMYMGDLTFARLAIMEMLTAKAIGVGANGIVNMRIHADPAGGMQAIGDAVSVVPML